MLNDFRNPGEEWFESQGWKVFSFQEETWTHFGNGNSGLVNAPTGSGKTYSVFIGALTDFLKKHPELKTQPNVGLQLIWITPIKALAKEIANSCRKAIQGFDMKWEVNIRTGDTTTTDRQKQKKQPPEVLITTPESLHIILATAGYPDVLKNLSAIVVDEWHELVGSKRGVQTELAISRLLAIRPALKIWGISATIGNMAEAMDILLFPIPSERRKLIQSDIKKEIVLETLIPDEIENFSWTGHLGIKMAEKVVPLIRKYGTTLIFTNTRAQCEIWYQRLLEMDPDLAGMIAMHHGSISKEIRDWVEDALYEGKIKVIVCTSSLDLGVDFRPVDCIIQIGSPKGVSRFIQRAGRSGHQPGAVSRIYFVPTHSLEMTEAAGLRLAIQENIIEERIPYIRSFDVLIQYLMTLAVSEGFFPTEILKEIRSTFCFESISDEEWNQILSFLLHGSTALQAYDEYHKVGIAPDGRYLAMDKHIAQRHKLSIGTIASDTMIQIKLLKGTRLGSVEEWFVSQLNPGDSFWFAGHALELIRVKEMTAQVRYSQSDTGKIPSYMGGRMSFSTQMSGVLRKKIHDYSLGIVTDVEIEALRPLLQLQATRSLIPDEDTLLVEYFESNEGFHLVCFPFEGRSVHEGMGALIAKRISVKFPVSFSIAMNDYGFELLSDQKIDVNTLVQKELFSADNLSSDIQSSLNSVEMAKRRFRDIAKISGLIFTGFPGRQKKERHLQSGAQLLFEVFKEYEPNNLLFLQTYDEVMTFQLEESRLRLALQRIQHQNIKISLPDKATPFAFPIIAERLRERLTSEKLEDRIRKMKLDLLK
ncbi:MAG: ligase-associated DNA damage response DEXH box helicase [Saprospiraceae bacterium]|nr:ligase-associated DNA damage response DEXH box helicase [Saprospiraceae bacterium]